MTAYGGQSITYDNSGNPTSYHNGARWTFSWAKGRQLASASSSDTSASYTYDISGTRNGKTVDGTVYRYNTLSGHVMRQEWDGKSIDFIYDDANQPYAMRYRSSAYATPTTYYFVLNLQGDVVALIDSSASIVARYEYDPWGAVTVKNPNGTVNTSPTFIGNINPLRYRGYYYDTETGFYYLQSRYYDPVIGRFINADGQINGGLLGSNLFAYCGNNPVNRSDPNGELSELLIGGALLGGIINLAGTYFAALLTGQELTTGAKVGAFVGGAIGGLLIFTEAGIGDSTLVNAVAGGVGYVTTQIIDGQAITLDGATKAMTTGAVTGLFSGGGIFSNEEVAKQSSIYDSYIYNIHNAAEEVAFTAAAEAFQGAAGKAIIESVINSSVASIIGNCINNIINNTSCTCLNKNVRCLRK